MSQLNEDQIQALNSTIVSTGWKTIIAPSLENRARLMLKALALAPSEREKAGGEFKDADDASLRAGLRECEWMLAVWSNHINVYRMNKALAERDAQQNGETTSPLIPTADPSR